MIQRWKPNVTVAGIIERNHRFLLVEENTTDGVRLNQPAGHLEEGESILEAARREVLEETAHPFTPESLVGIYQWVRPAGDITYLRFAFTGHIGERISDRQLDEGIIRTVWMSLEELRDSRERHRSPIILRCVEDYLSGKRHGLDLLLWG